MRKYNLAEEPEVSFPNDGRDYPWEDPVEEKVEKINYNNPDAFNIDKFATINEFGV